MPLFIAGHIDLCYVMKLKSRCTIQCGCSIWYVSKLLFQIISGHFLQSQEIFFTANPRKIGKTNKLTDRSTVSLVT